MHQNCYSMIKTISHLPFSLKITRQQAPITLIFKQITLHHIHAFIQTKNDQQDNYVASTPEKIRIISFVPVYILVIHPYLLPHGTTTRLKSSRGTGTEANTPLRTALAKLRSEVSEILRWRHASDVCQKRSRRSSRITIPFVPVSQPVVPTRQAACRSSEGRGILSAGLVFNFP